MENYKRKFRIMKELFEAVYNLLKLIIYKIYQNILCKLDKDLS